MTLQPGAGRALPSLRRRGRGPGRAEAAAWGGGGAARVLRRVGAPSRHGPRPPLAPRGAGERRSRQPSCRRARGKWRLRGRPGAAGTAPASEAAAGSGRGRTRPSRAVPRARCSLSNAALPREGTEQARAHHALRPT